MSFDDGLFPASDEYLSRDEARAVLLAALAAPRYTGSVYHLIGQGGIGKTYELRWLHEQALERRRMPDSDLLETGIIDLAHTRYQQPLLLMDTLAQRISHSLQERGDTRGYFDTFFHEAARYLSLVEVESQRLESQRAVRNLFLEGYRAATTGRRLLITIDTIERLDPSLPEVARYDVLRLERLEVWLASLLTDLPNSLTVIAGRPRPRQAHELEQRLGDRFVRRIALPHLAPAEVKAIVERYAKPERHYDVSWYERMQELSGGLPVRLIVALEIARACDFDPEQLPPSLRDPDPNNLDQLGHDFAKTFVEQLYTTNPGLAQLIEQACYLRKGLYPDLLQALDDAAQPAVSDLLEQLAEFGFVKVSGDGILTLHDDVYDLLEDRIGVANADRWRVSAIDFLAREQARLLDEISRQGMTIERLGQLRMTQIDRLYYQLARAPLLWGYQNYCELAYGAIFARDREFDRQLQDELARFFDPDSQSGRAYRARLQLEDYAWERIVYDEAARWVFRCIHATELIGGGRNRALELADQIEHDHQVLLAADPLTRCALETARLEVSGILAATDTEFAAVEVRNTELVQVLQQIEAETAAIPQPRPIHHYRHRQSRFLRAYALNNWGYLARRRMQLNTAIARYGEAIALYKTLGDETNILQGTCLTNLSFAYRLQGDQEAGLLFIEEAIRLLHGAGARYREATAYNTRAHLLLDLSDLLGAARSIERAGALLRDFPGTRNTALYYFAEATYERLRAYRSRDDVTESDAAYVRAIACYREFQDYFDQRPGDRERRFEARQGLGCAYRSRGEARILRGEDGSADLDEARRWLQEALALLSPDDQQRRADLYEDIARSYVLQRCSSEAFAALEQAAQAIPPAFDVRPGAGAVETAITREQKLFWLLRAKVELQRGLCHLDRGAAETASEHLLRAFACLLRFAPESSQLTTFRDVARRYLWHHCRGYADGVRELQALRQKTYLIAQHLGTREAFFKLEQVFDQVEQMLKLL